MFSGLECFSHTVYQVEGYFPIMVQIQISGDSPKLHLFLKIFTGFSDCFLGNHVVTPGKLPERRR
jgi:hypothetical protein